uniref:Uncharacterized protein n=1 Tax=Arundo donax TaxID=35708 RepID=A0A0A9CI24_ARUDO
MQDPALLSVLKNMGWEDVDTDSVKRTGTPSTSHAAAQKSSKTKGQIQKELLGLKRKALAFRREGKSKEAEEELEKAKVLEQQLAEIEESSYSDASEQVVRTVGVDASVLPSSVVNTMKGDVLLPVHADESVTSMDTLGSSPSKPQTETIISSPSDTLGFEKGSHTPSDALDHKEAQKEHGDTLKDEILLHKRKAVAFKRERKMAEAREELKLAKLLEKRLEGAQQNSVDGGHDTTAPVVQQSNLIQQPASASKQIDASASAPPAQTDKSTQPPKAMSSRDRLKIQRESLAHKRNALKLRREGKTAEADTEFELAKELESQLEDSDNQGSSSGGKADEPNDAVVENLLDPQMMLALKSIGWSDADLSMQSSNAQPPRKVETKPAAVVATSRPQSERSQLEEQIKAEKLKALALKREGKQAEALEALRSSKRLEKKLASLC